MYNHDNNNSFQPYTPPPPPQSHQPNPRKKRTKLIRILHSNCSTSTTTTSAGVHNNVTNNKPKYGYKKPDPSAPKITRPCSECGKKFWSWKALFGHMRCHPERQWRGINPPPNLIGRTSTSSDYDSKITQEDHAVASCLLMLANNAPPSTAHMLETSEEAAAATAMGDGDVEGGVAGFGPSPSSTGSANANCSRFECSSCNKVFGSGQALGGHRASHKNVKGCFAITRKDHGGGAEEEDHGGIHGVRDHRHIISQLGDQEVKVSGDDNKPSSTSSALMVTAGGDHHYQCSICLRVFSSSQALGGHKRCHWEKADEPPPADSPDDHCGPLDLNLPAAVAVDDDDGNDNDDDYNANDSQYSCYSSGGLALDLRLGL